MSAITMLINECKVIVDEKIPQVEAINDQLEMWANDAASELAQLRELSEKLNLSQKENCKLRAELDEARKVIDAAAHELGIPIPGYIQPVANAAYMLWAWLKAHPERK